MSDPVAEQMCATMDRLEARAKRAEAERDRVVLALAYLLKAARDRAEAERDRLAEALRSIDRLLVKEELSEGIEVTIPPDNHQLIGQIVLSYLAGRAALEEAGDG